jgi:hypothetical protein
MKERIVQSHSGNNEQRSSKMSRPSQWDQLIAKAETCKLDMDFVKSQIEGTVFGEVCDQGDHLDELLKQLDVASRQLVFWAEGLRQAPEKKALHRIK